VCLPRVESLCNDAGVAKDMVDAWVSGKSLTILFTSIGSARLLLAMQWRIRLAVATSDNTEPTQLFEFVSHSNKAEGGYSHCELAERIRILSVPGGDATEAVRNARELVARATGLTVGAATEGNSGRANKHWPPSSTGAKYWIVDVTTASGDISRQAILRIGALSTGPTAHRTEAVSRGWPGLQKCHECDALGHGYRQCPTLAFALRIEAPHSLNRQHLLLLKEGSGATSGWQGSRSHRPRRFAHLFFRGERERDIGKVLICSRPPVAISGVRKVDARVPLGCNACGLLREEIVPDMPPHAAQGACPLLATTSGAWIVTSQKRAWHATQHYFAEAEWINKDCRFGGSTVDETTRC
jgi:hypothetical protein